MNGRQTAFGGAGIALAAACAGLAACGTAPRERLTTPTAPSYEAQVINPDLDGGMRVPGSNTFLVWGSDGSILRSNDGTTWTHGLTTTDVEIERIASNADGSVLIAVGAQGTILRSVDTGRRWQIVARELTHADLRAVAHQAATGTWIAAGGHGNILRSTDGGQNWSPVESALDAEYQALFVDPRTQAILLGGEQGLVGISNDAGVSFHLTWLAMPDPKTPVTAFYRHENLLLATSALGRFATSTDDARSWDLMQADTQAFFTAAAFDARRGAWVLTGHNGDVLHSHDAGKTWQTSAVSIDGRKSYLSALHYEERSGSLLAVGNGGTVARSIDGGVSWSKTSEDVTTGLRGLIDDPVLGRLIGFGAGGMLLSSTDSGAHWNTLHQSLDFQLREVARVPGSAALIATSTLGDIIRSPDGGQNWSPVALVQPNPNTPPDLRALAENSRHELIAAGPPGAILRATADATAWQFAHWTDIEKERAFTGMLVDRKRGLLVAIEARGEMQVSRDAGETWRPSVVPGAGDDFTYWHGSLLQPAGVMLIAGKSGAAARSTDGAESWSTLHTNTQKNLYGSYADDRTGLIFLMGQDGTLLRSRDLGVSWVAIPSGSTAELRRMTRVPRSPALLCFGAHGAILRSGDDGLTWRTIESGTQGVLRTALREPGTGNLLLVGGQGTLLRSIDSGLSWQRLPTHTTRHLSSMVAGGNGELILAGERLVRLVPH